MTAYELIDSNLTLIVKLMNNGLISPKMVEHLEIYEQYHSLTGVKGERYEALAKRYNLKPDTIKKIILKLSKHIK